jgi:4-diphosphocytidyl-2-C-methyl-D-erythritol kinase
MIFSSPCFIKLNLTLRVLERRDDGYHNIFSLFWRLRSPEAVEADFDSGRENLDIEGGDISGENILTRTCRHIRNLCGEDSLPPVSIRLCKHIPVGSGVGAGSGNAAALLGIFRALRGEDTVPELSSLGADVAFLAGRDSLALAGGIGDELVCVGDALNLAAVIFFPEWRSDTARAYRKLDEARAGSCCFETLGAEGARREALSVLNLLKRGERVGRLPNDFDLCAGHGGEYAVLDEAADNAGALAWGLCGSGSAFFALFKPDERDICLSAALDALRGKDGGNAFRWLRKILVLE